MNNYKNYVVHIKCHQQDIDLNHPLNVFSNAESTGTGFFIEGGLILTCYHVVQNSLEILITIYKDDVQEKIKAHVKYIFPDDDLAVLELEDNNIQFKVFNYHILTSSEINISVNTVGFPSGSTTLKINKGVISGFQDSKIQTDSTLNPGNSGGPLLLNNKVIGINQSKLSGNNSNTGFSIPIFRFLILFKLQINNLILINNKPTLLITFQKNLQKIYGYDYGVRISEIHDKSLFIKNNIFVNDLILQINNCKIDNEGKILFSFFPEKIDLTELGLWFACGDELEFILYSHILKTKYIKKITITFIETNLINYYSESNKKYYFENKGLIFSIFTDYHYERLLDIEMSMTNKIKLLSQFISLNNKFTVYLSDLIYSKLKFSDYPLHEIIICINNKQITDYLTFIEIIKEPITSFKTLNNNIYYVI